MFKNDATCLEIPHFHSINKKKQKTTTTKTVKNARMLKGSKGKKDSEKVISGN